MADGKRRGGGSGPPDGGWGWVVVGSCFMVMVCTRAVTRCLSVFFTELQTHFGADRSATAWIHSLVDCTTMLCAPVGSLVGSRWSCRAAVMAGGVLSSCGLLISSFTTRLELLYLSMGVLTGLGFALCYTPAIATVGCYFGRRRRALAYGAAMSGSGIGTLVLAPAVQKLMELYSWQGALLVLSAFVSNLCVCGALLRPIAPQEEEEGEESGGRRGEGRRRAGTSGRQEVHVVTRLSPAAGGVSSPDAELASKQAEDRRSSPSPSGGSAPPATGKWHLGSFLLSSEEYRFLLLPDFLFLAVSFLFLASGCSLPFVFLVPYALSVGVAPPHAAFLMSILGVVDIVGNVTFGWLTDRRCLRRHRLSCYLVAVAMEGLSCLLVPLLRSFGPLVPFAVLYGYFDGAYVALIPVVTSDVVGAPCLPSALGVVYFLHAVPYLLSPPVAGWLADVTGTYTPTFLLSGAALLVSALVLSAVAGIRRCGGGGRRATVLGRARAPPPSGCDIRSPADESESTSCLDKAPPTIRSHD